jgi:hypothetical protein
MLRAEEYHSFVMDSDRFKENYPMFASFEINEQDKIVEHTAEMPPHFGDFSFIGSERHHTCNHSQL